MVGIEQLVIDHLGQHVVLPGQSIQFVEFGERQHGRFFDQHVLAGRECAFGGREMSVVGRGHADEIDARFEQLFDARGFGETLERPDAPRGRFSIGFGPLAGAAGHGGQFQLADAETRPVNRLFERTLEAGAIRFVEDHAHADHSGPQTANFGMGTLSGLGVGHERQDSRPGRDLPTWGAHDWRFAPCQAPRARATMSVSLAEPRRAWETWRRRFFQSLGW